MRISRIVDFQRNQYQKSILLNKKTKIVLFIKKNHSIKILIVNNKNKKMVKKKLCKNKFKKIKIKINKNNKVKLVQI